MRELGEAMGRAGAPFMSREMKREIEDIVAQAAVAMDQSWKAEYTEDMG